MGKKVSTQVKKQIKKLHPLTKVIMVIVLIASFAGSFFFMTNIQKNDLFELKGEKVINIFINENYQEPKLNEAVVCISLGKNVIDSVNINQELTTYDPLTSTSVPGTYYIVYNSSNFKYSSINRIRTIIVHEIDINEDGLGE